MSFAAMWMTARKHIENWIVWLVVDIVATGIYLVQRSRDVRAACTASTSAWHSQGGGRGAHRCFEPRRPDRRGRRRGMLRQNDARAAAGAAIRGAVGARIRARATWRASATDYDEADVLAIASGQQRAEMRRRRRADSLIADTDLVVIRIWWNVRYGGSHRWIDATLSRTTYGTATARLPAADARYSVDTRSAARTSARAAGVARALSGTARRSRCAILEVSRIAEDSGSNAAVSRVRRWLSR